MVLFALQGEQITDRPLDVARVAVPLLVYFAVMWFGAFITGYRLGLPYDRNASVAFTAAGNNFELAIAVAIAVFGVTSGQALAGTIGRSSRSPYWSPSCTSRCGPGAAGTRSGRGARGGGRRRHFRTLMPRLASRSRTRAAMSSRIARTTSTG